MRFAFTRSGLRFVLLLAIVGFAAYNNQNNVLYLLLSVGIASVAASAVFSWLSLQSLSFVAAQQPDAFAGVAFRERVTFENGSRLLNPFGLSVEGSTGGVSFIAGGGRASCHVERLYRRRGVYPGEAVKLATQFPFGLIQASRRVELRRELTVFPRVRSIDPDLLALRRGRESPHARRRGRSDEFFSLREYAPGDYRRNIHWKATAKVGRLMVREFGESEEERFCLGLVQLPSRADPATFEHLITAAASLATHFVRNGVSFRFLSNELELAPGGSHEHLRAVLRHLATTSPVTELTAEFCGRVDAAVRSGEKVLLIGLGSPAGTAADVWLVTPRELLPGLSESA